MKTNAATRKAASEIVARKGCMPFAQFLRIETLAGGAGCSDRAFIRAAHTLLSPVSRVSGDARPHRHRWIRDGLFILAHVRRLSF